MATSDDVRLVLVYTSRAAAFAAAVYILGIGSPPEFVPLYLQYVIAIAALIVVATAIGVGAMRWPITTLLAPVAAGIAFSGIDHPGILFHVIWLSWIMGTVVKMVLLLLALPSPGAAPGPHAPDVGQPREERSLD